jgi:putative CocE/NonD family hydrolase
VERTDFTAKLVDVFPDGRAYNLSEGIVRVSRPREVAIDLWPTSNVFLPGHRVRLEVSSSNFPRYDRALLPAFQTIFHDALRPSRLMLPIVRG